MGVGSLGTRHHYMICISSSMPACSRPCPPRSTPACLRSISHRNLLKQWSFLVGKLKPINIWLKTTSNPGKMKILPFCHWKKWVFQFTWRERRVEKTMEQIQHFSSILNLSLLGEIDPWRFHSSTLLVDQLIGRDISLNVICDKTPGC